ncbi:MAG: hypothetical protein FWH27_07375 [Planctomycetaceae bacterium]|nr:hypothetical protein [Planctomycetaceae bacterium]
MAKAKAPKPPKPVKAKKEKPVKAKKEKAPRQPKAVKPRVPKVKVKSDLYTVILMLTFFAFVTACVFMYLNNSFHTAYL